MGRLPAAGAFGEMRGFSVQNCFSVLLSLLSVSYASITGGFQTAGSTQGPKGSLAPWAKHVGLSVKNCLSGLFLSLVSVLYDVSEFFVSVDCFKLLQWENMWLYVKFAKIKQITEP